MDRAEEVWADAKAAFVAEELEVYDPYGHTSKDQAAVSVIREELWERCKSVGQKVVERAASHIQATPRIRSVRKDRISPTAKKSERRHPTKHCRRASRFHRNLSSAAPREPRDMHEMNVLRMRLHDAQGGLCGICGEKIFGKVSLDHVIPHALLGEHGTGNYVAAHGECNGDKTNDVPTGCEMVWLLAVNAKLGLTPVVY